jgi:transcriptional antiterminator RfaH
MPDILIKAPKVKPVWTVLNTKVPEWAVIRTAARWEKKLAETYSSLGIDVFLPLLTRVSKYKSRTNQVEVPVFSGYVFFDYAKKSELGREEYARKGIAQIIRSPDPITLTKELLAVSTLLSNAQLVQTKIFGDVGDVVRIRKGPFENTEGTIMRHLVQKRRLVLSISFLGLSTEVELDESNVEKV